MKQTIFIIITILSIISFQGCGENHNDDIISGSAVSMSVGVEYTVSSGDILTPLTSDTVIEVLHTLSDGTKTVKITSGSATLLRGTYDS